MAKTLSPFAFELIYYLPLLAIAFVIVYCLWQLSEEEI